MIIFVKSMLFPCKDKPLWARYDVITSGGAKREQSPEKTPENSGFQDLLKQKKTKRNYFKISAWKAQKQIFNQFIICKNRRAKK